MLLLHDKGNCLCPHCLTPKEKVGDLGMRQDSIQRVKMAHKDSYTTDHDIEAARQKIYRPWGAKVNSKAMEDILKYTSQVLTVVSLLRVIFIAYIK